MSSNANIIPADMTVNFMITLAWEISNKYLEKGDAFNIDIYNYSSSNDKVRK